MARTLRALISPLAGIKYDPGIENVPEFSIADVPTIAFSFANGTNAALKVDLVAAKTYALAGAVQTVDLTTLTDPVGQAVNLARVKYIMVANYSVVDGQNLLLDLTVSNAWKAPVNAITTAKLVVPNGATGTNGVVPGLLMIAAPGLTGLAVSGTSKLITLDPGANSYTARVYLLGCVA